MNHIDWLVERGDFVIDQAGFIQEVSDRQSIGQDVKHRVIESGILHNLIGERSELERQALINRLLIEVDKDSRLKPGTAKLIEIENEPGVYVLTADTLEYGAIEVRI